MSESFEIFTGTLFYRDISFIFSFDKTELRLIPSESDRHIVEWDWKMTSTGSGTFVFADPIYIEEPFLIGKCNETNSKIVFIPKQGSTLGFLNSIVRISLSAYIIFQYDRDEIDRICFSCPEINYIHPINQALTINFPSSDFQNNGVIAISTDSFDATTTEKQKFIVDGKTINIYFAISRTVSTKIHEPPLRMDSSLVFEFEPTNDFKFIYKLWLIARDFIRFLCYRNNVYISKVELSSPFTEGKHEKCATMYLQAEEGDLEVDVLKKGRFIKQINISGHEGEILSDIADGSIYLRHLPDTFRLGRNINAARFVMITAAFEWEFRRTHPGGIQKSDKTIKAEETVLAHIQECINSTSGKQKKLYKFLIRRIGEGVLQSEIMQVGKELSSIIGIFGDHLYKLNKEKLVYSEMGKRISDQRNHFAHGDLDKDFIGLALLDLIYLEYIIYAMQLKYYGVEDKNIQRSINDLFHLGFSI